ncbi:TolC family protein [Pseudomonas chlororaphis]|uniref:TolC family protein n=1 Tax=Pseudomonas chlororaphis TaxID=587753 RepID=UPI0005F8EACA|nr:TolC family protein [Pseudomonas chlororaphis]
MKRHHFALLAWLAWGPVAALAHEPDVFATTTSVTGEAVYDVDHTSRPCHFGNLPEQLSLEETVSRILCHDPQVRIAWADAKARAATVGVSHAAYLPRLDGRLDWSRNINERKEASVSVNGRRQLTGANFTLSWVLFDFGRRGAALQNARQMLMAANATQDATLQNAFAVAAQAYNDALAAQRNLAASRQVAELAAQNLEAADAKYKAGAAALSDQLQAQTALSQARLREVRDIGNLRQLLGVIALRMGLSPETPLKLAGDLAPLPNPFFSKAVDELLAEARREHPALLAAQARFKAAEASVEEARAAGRPSLSLTANLAHNRVGQSEIYNGDYLERDRSIGLQLDVPLFDGFSRSYQVRRALAQVESRRSELADTEQQVSLDVWNNYQRLSIETRSLAQTSELVEQSRQALDVVQGRYRAGVGSMIELLNALTAYASAEELHTQALGSWQSSRLRLAVGLGRLGFWAVDTR